MTRNTKCPTCGQQLMMMIGNTPIDVTINVWNDNNQLSEMPRDKKNNPIPTCCRCGKVKKWSDDGKDINNKRAERVKFIRQKNR